jgi:hypothetical protein
MAYDEVLMVRIDKDLLTRSKSLAEEQNISQSSLVRQSLELLCSKYSKHNQVKREQEMIRQFNSY